MVESGGEVAPAQPLQREPSSGPELGSAPLVTARECSEVFHTCASELSDNASDLLAAEEELEEENEEEGGMKQQQGVLSAVQGTGSGKALGGLDEVRELFLILAESKDFRCEVCHTLNYPI